MMIYPELKNYLTQVSSPETVQFFDDAVEILEKYDVPDYMAIFENVIGDKAERDDIAVVDALLVNLRTILDYLLRMYGVVLYEDVLPSHVNAVAGGLFDVTLYEDKIAVTNCLDSDETTLEKLCSLLTLTTQYTVEELMAVVESVEDNFIAVFRDRQTRMVPVETAEVTQVQKQIDAYAKYKKHILNEAIYPDRFFGNVGSIGLPFEDYMRMYLTDHSTQLSQMTPEPIAKDLVAMAFLSKDAADAPLVFIRKHLSTLFADINVTTQINIAVSKLIVEIDHAQA